jgi:hypothetical protein
MRFEFDYEHWQATRLLDKCWRDRVMADQPPVSAVAFEAFKFMNATKRRTSTCNPITRSQFDLDNLAVVGVDPVEVIEGDETRWLN